MTNQHPITPPLELVMQWDTEAASANMPDRVYIATEAARWGSNQELEACKKVILDQGWFAIPGFRLNQLHNARRPKPPSLKEQALARTDAILNDPNRALLAEVRETLEMNRRALEQLKDD